MLRELLDKAALEDFVGGLARASGLRVAAYDAHGELISASAPIHAFALLRPELLETLPRPMEMTPLPADEPPARVAFVLHQRLWTIVAPVYLNDAAAGFVGVGPFREPGAGPPAASSARGEPPLDAGSVQRAWEALPVLRRSGDAHGVVTVRWASRTLAERCRREAELDSAADQLALLADIGELLAGEQDLQRLLDRIVAETARVMRCPACSLRLFEPASGEMRIAARHNLSDAYIEKGALRRQESPIDDEALRGAVVFVEDVASDPRIRFPEEAQREGIVSILTVGMTYHAQPIGVLRVYTSRRQRFRGSQRRLLRAVASQAAIAIVNARLAEERLRAAQVERQLALAGALQRRMVRTPPPAFAAVDAALVFDPTWHIGGDFGDFLILPDGRFAALVADVVGHGLPASLLMAYMRGALRAAAGRSSDLGELLRGVNEQLCRETEPGEFATALIVAVDPAGRELSYCNAGHEPPLVLRGGRAEQPDDGGTVLGLEAGEQYRELRLPLAAGDFVLLYTDGAVEAMNYAGEHFGRPRLTATLLAHLQESPRRTLQQVHWEIRRFTGLAEQSDDLTLVGLRIRAPISPCSS